jgi:exosortase/archaeosortase family protein
LYFLKALTAQAANFILGLLGVPTILQFLAEPSIIVGKLTAQITNLCAGDIEIILMTAIILSTFDRSWRQRLFGVLGGILIVLIINPLRIAAVIAVGYYSSWQWADFTHDVLFRLTLLVVIVGYYYIWYIKYGSIARLIKRK